MWATHFFSNNLWEENIFSEMVGCSTDICREGTKELAVTTALKLSQ